MYYSKKNHSTLVAVMACAAAFGITACSDSSSSGTSNDTLLTLSGEIVGDTLVLDMNDSTYELKISTDGNWVIKDNSMFVQSIDKTEGVGDATVKLRLTSNDLDERLVGSLNIEFSSQEDQKIVLIQKYRGDYGDNASQLTKSNKIYAVGYGYNAISGYYADYTSVKAEIFDTKTLIENGDISEGPTDVMVDTWSWSDVDLHEAEVWLSERAKIKQTSAAFTGEVRSSFIDYGGVSEGVAFAMTFIDVAVKTVGVDEALMDEPKTEYMKASAYNAINGLDKKFTTDREGFKKLIQRYGTHVVLGSTLGGRIRQSMYAEGGYEYGVEEYALVASSRALDKKSSVDAGLYESFDEYWSELSYLVKVLGGDAALALDVADSRALDADVVKDWQKSLAENENATLIDFSGDGLVPLYELIDEKLGEDAVKRKAALKAYMEGKDIVEDFEALL